jgi:hypothetical protein
MRAKIIHLKNGSWYLGRKGKSVKGYKDWAKSWNRYNKKDKIKIVAVKDRKPMKKRRNTNPFRVPSYPRGWGI